MKREASKNLTNSLRLASFAAIIGSIIVNAPKMTGNVVSNQNFSTFSFLGTLLLCLGLVGVFLTRKTKF